MCLAFFQLQSFSGCRIITTNVKSTCQLPWKMADEIDFENGRIEFSTSCELDLG